ncbi:MAG: MFS transporter [Proteobacteria bacterium]|jgi:GPH family glycoside/pentoside/hexuronide:cation symporter|nr:MFS transporter [Pseudomonadota bacterium]NCV21948.1 MFS transporter [Chloroflexota bacterium]NBT04553.1 MFS transporter [Pseudomonadota bacterium]NBT18837.1 MFS transporter [Pseudomonadota bacterium]NBY49090.1 MFS transporter [Pseudomonadota bacterium]
MTTATTDITQSEPQARTSQFQRWMFGGAMMGITMPGQVFGVSLLFFYTDVKHLPPSWAATALTIYAIYNAVNNPLIGYWQDRTRFRLGRRIPWLRYGSVPFLVTFAALWLAPFDGNDDPVALLIYFFVAIVIYDGFNSAVGNSYYALLPEMFVNYRERTDVAAKMMIFLTVALLLGVALPPVIGDRLGWGTMGTIFAGISLVAILIGQAGMVESAETQEPTMSFTDALRYLATNRSFLTLTFAQTLRFVTTNSMATGMAFFVKYTLKIDGAQTGIILATAFIVSAIMLYPWRQLIANRYEPRTTGLIAYATVAVGMVPLWFVTDLATTVAAAVLIGVGFAGIFLMDNMLISDVIDEDEVRTGTRREAMYVGMNGMVITLSTAIVFVAFGLISSIYGYDASLAQQPASVSDGFRIFMALLPCAGCATAFLVLQTYPLHGERLREMKRELVRLRTGRAPGYATQKPNTPVRS